MLNKDQYNQEEYNDYYRQETQAAEIKGSKKEEGNGKTIIIFLTLLLLGVAGYFGFKNFGNSKEVETGEKKIKTANIEESTTKENETLIETVKNIESTNKTKSETIIEAKVPNEQLSKVQDEKRSEIKTDENIETKVTTAIENSVDASQKMSPEEIAKVVQIVMMQMNKKNNDTTNKPLSKSENKEKEEETTNDTDLMAALSESMVDTITEDEKTDYTGIETNKNLEVKENKQTLDTYNKVTIQTTSGDDELSKLSEQISNVIKEAEETSTSITSSSNTYTKSITKEVATRSNAMRIIIVKKGDTLGKIAKRAYGNVMDYKKIYAANPDLINRPDRIYVGQKLSIPE